MGPCNRWGRALCARVAGHGHAAPRMRHPGAMRRDIPLSLIFLAACGPVKASTTPPPADQGHEHGELPPAVEAFHEVLSPRWHAEKGDARVKDTCDASGEFATRADALVQLAPPQGADPTRWAATTRELREAVTALDAACKTGDAAGFEPAFHRVHEGFHAVMEAAGAPPHEPGHG